MSLPYFPAVSHSFPSLSFLQPSSLSSTGRCRWTWLPWILLKVVSTPSSASVGASSLTSTLRVRSIAALGRHVSLSAQSHASLVSSICLFVRLCLCSSTHAFIQSFVHSLLHLLVRSFVHFINSFTRVSMHSFICPFDKILGNPNSAEL